MCIRDRHESERAAFKYGHHFFALYLLVFTGLWFYALPEYMAAETGLTARGTPTGSLAFVAACYLVCGFILLMSRPSKPQLAQTIS